MQNNVLIGVAVLPYVQTKHFNDNHEKSIA